MAVGGYHSVWLISLYAVLAVSFFMPAAAITPLTKAVNWQHPDFLTRHFLESNTKPILYVIHKSWCPACEYMRKEFADFQAAQEFVRLSRDFVMIEAMDDDEPEDPAYGPDGGYYPRAVLMDPSGKIRPEYLPNKEPNTDFKYTFYYPPQMVEVMNEIKSDVDSGALSNHAKNGGFNPGYSGDGSY